MSSSSPRRSPRTITRFCAGRILTPLTPRQTALVISLAQLTGWSAERISLSIFDKTAVRLSAEAIWSFHWEWVLSHEAGQQEKLTEDELVVMRLMLEEAGVTLVELEEGKVRRALYKTVQPVTVPFLKSWSPKSVAGLCPDFDRSTRTLSKIHIFEKVEKGINENENRTISSSRVYGKLTPTEVHAVKQFGSPTTTILADILKRWSHVMRAKLRRDPEYRPVREKEHVHMIMEYLRLFQETWEGVFGLMEEQRPNEEGLGPIKNQTVYINSTGYGAKVLLGLIMADRIHVVERLGTSKREELGYLMVDRETLDPDCRNCAICQDEMGVENPEGTSERAIKLVVCCGQAIGESCLRAWLSEKIGGLLTGNCPVCRYHFQDAFLEKLFDGLERPRAEAEEGMDFRDESEPDYDPDEPEDLPASDNVVHEDLHHSRSASPSVSATRAAIDANADQAQNPWQNGALFHLQDVELFTRGQRAGVVQAREELERSQRNITSL